MAQTHDHEVVSIYPFSEDEVNALVENAVEAVLMWSTRDGWPVGVTHAFIWRDGTVCSALMICDDTTIGSMPACGCAPWV